MEYVLSKGTAGGLLAMPQVNKKLDRAKLARYDEFYTLYEDIAAELPHYREQMRGARIICPCDWDESLDEMLVYASEEYVAGRALFSSGGKVKTIDARQMDGHIEKSLDTVRCNFVKFLIAHAEPYGIASITVSGYNPDTEEGVRFQDVDYSNYDLVITNPPFSEFEEFIDVMFANSMRFIVIGPLLAAKRKNVFPRIKANQMWPGYNTKAGSRKGNSMYFLVNDEYQNDNVVEKDGARLAPQSTWWYTNLDVTYRHDWKILTEEYDPAVHLSYTNFDGIDVPKTRLIPYDYAGNMGVPTSFLREYNPEQFEIVGLGEGDLAKEIGITRNHEGRTKIEVRNQDGTFRRPGPRIVIRNRKPRPTDE